jgi:hypothetical protein
MPLRQSRGFQKCIVHFKRMIFITYFAMSVIDNRQKKDRQCKGQQKKDKGKNNDEKKA